MSLLAGRASALKYWVLASIGTVVLLLGNAALAHTIAGNDANYVQGIDGPAIAPFIYLGAKHMVTGYDHLLYLLGVVFFLYRPIQVLQYVSLFALGHSITLLTGVLANLQVNAYLIDAIIGFSIVYKAFENMGGFAKLGTLRPNPKAAVFIFGLFHGLGLATKLQAFELSPNGLVTNIISFNVGVELGQLLALSAILLLLSLWRTRANYTRQALVSNTLLMSGGFMLTAYQLAALFIDSAQL
jgi:hypothetical protein